MNYSILNKTHQLINYIIILLSVLDHHVLLLLHLLYNYLQHVREREIERNKERERTSLTLIH